MMANGAVRVFRDEQPASPILASADEAFGWLLGHQPMSTDWAMKHEGYSIRPVIAEPWPDDAGDPWHSRQAIRGMALNVMRHDHPKIGTPAWDRWLDDNGGDVEMIRENCHACALEGYGEVSGADSSSGFPEPNGAFPRTHIQAGRPIPRRWARALHWYLNDADHNEPHRLALLRDLATWGVRFTD
jgi:hypothetical protein